MWWQTSHIGNATVPSSRRWPTYIATGPKQAMSNRFRGEALFGKMVPSKIVSFGVLIGITSGLGRLEEVAVGIDERLRSPGRVCLRCVISRPRPLGRRGSTLGRRLPRDLDEETCQTRITVRPMRTACRQAVA
nr:unnamed protein product [Digitaria exilis]